MNEPVLRCVGLTKVYHTSTAPVNVLRGIDLSVAPGERVAIIGKSGSGKSTLLHLLGGLDAPSAGRVEVQGRDLATLTETQRSRENKEDSGIDNFFGKTKLPIMNTPVPTRMFTGDSSSSSDGKGTINRQEALTTNVAAVITQVLPNGNLVIEGKQEVRVNSEIRELIVAGIVRPEDIESDNTIDSTKIAEARIAYGGRGQITDVQQPRYGQQFFDAIWPF